MNRCGWSRGYPITKVLRTLGDLANVNDARKKSKRRFQLKQAQPLLSSQDIFCEGMTIKSGEAGTKRKVKSCLLAFFISRKKLQNIRPTNNGFTISQRKARHQRLAFCVFGESYHRTASKLYSGSASRRSAPHRFSAQRLTASRFL